MALGIKGNVSASHRMAAQSQVMSMVADITREPAGLTSSVREDISMTHGSIVPGRLCRKANKSCRALPALGALARATCQSSVSRLTIPPSLLQLQSHLIPGLNLAAVGLFPASSSAVPPPPSSVTGAAPYGSFMVGGRSYYPQV